jgi:mxaL protein
MTATPMSRLLTSSTQWRLAAALLLLLVSVLMPELRISRRTYNYMVTFDITQSMNVEDVELDGQPVRRLVLARAALRDVLRHLPCGSKIGWSVFSGYRTLVLLDPIEVCANYEVLLSSLDKIGDQMRWANASNIGKGLYWVMRNAKRLTPAHFVFITDGHEAPPVAADDVIPPATDPGEVDGIIIGVGGLPPTRIPKTNSAGLVTGYWTHEELLRANGELGDGHEELSERHDQHLAGLAQHNGVSYEPLISPTLLTQTLTQRRWAQRNVARTNLSWVPALLALLLLVWNYLPMRRRSRQTVQGTMLNKARIAAPAAP